jgi:hypothetical protein
MSGVGSVTCYVQQAQQLIVLEVLWSTDCYFLTVLLAIASSSSYFHGSQCGYKSCQYPHNTFNQSHVMDTVDKAFSMLLW